MCHQSPSSSLFLVLKFGTLKTIMSNYFQEIFNSHVSASAGVADAATENIWNNMKISGTTWRLACSRQLRCVAQLCPVIGVMKPSGGISTWKRPFLPRGKISRPGRLVKALGYHTMQPNAFPDMHCTMLVKKPIRRPTRILIPRLQKSTALLTSLLERTLMLLVANRWRMMQGRCQWAKSQNRRPD